MVRPKKNLPSESRKGSVGDDYFKDDFILDEREISQELGGCEMSSLLMDMLELSISKQTPLCTSLSPENEEILLEYYGYVPDEFRVRNGNRVETFKGVRKAGTEPIKGIISKEEFLANHLRNKILDSKNQELALKILKWLIDKFMWEDKK